MSVGNSVAIEARSPFSDVVWRLKIWAGSVGKAVPYVHLVDV